MSELLKNRKIIFFDYEVLSRSVHPVTNESWWCVVFIEHSTGKGRIIENNREELIRFHNQCKNDIFIGYNSRGYDQFVHKGLILGYDPGYISEQLITHKRKGYEILPNANSIQFYNFDIMPNPPVSLKTLEGFMGSDIRESSVPFDINREITKDEASELKKYCIHDVKETIKVFNILRHEFDSQLQLIETFDLDMSMFNKTKAQLSAEILGAEKHPDRGDEFNHIFPDTIILDKYSHVKEWFENFKSYNDEKGKARKLETVIAGVPTVYGIGGIHSSLDSIDESGIILACDISSMYPAIIIEYNLMSRNVPDKTKFKQIRDNRLILKAKKDPKQQPLKIVLNATYGTFKDKFNKMFDARMSNSICVTGQLALTDLAEKLEPYCKILQKNTDGIFLKVEKEEDIEIVKSVAKEWEIRTRFELEWERCTRLVQSNVNNYILVGEDGKVKAKGGFVKDLSEIDYDLPIVNKAIRNFFINNVLPEQTILPETKLIEFQKIVKVTSGYTLGALYGATFSKQPVFNEKTGKFTKKMMWDEGSGEYLKDKTFRVFASNKDSDGGLFKQKLNKNPEKFSNTSEKVFIDNNNIVGKEVPEYLDKQWYVELTYDRIRQFLGIGKKTFKKEDLKNYEFTS